MAQGNMYFSLYSLHQNLKSSSFSAIDLGKKKIKITKNKPSLPQRTTTKPKP